MVIAASHRILDRILARRGVAVFLRADRCELGRYSDSMTEATLAERIQALEDEQAIIRGPSTSTATGSTTAPRRPSSTSSPRTGLWRRVEGKLPERRFEGRGRAPEKMFRVTTSTHPTSPTSYVIGEPTLLISRSPATPRPPRSYLLFVKLSTPEGPYVRALQQVHRQLRALLRWKVADRRASGRARSTWSPKDFPPALGSISR